VERRSFVQPAEFLPPFRKGDAGRLFFSMSAKRLRHPDSFPIPLGDRYASRTGASLWVALFFSGRSSFSMGAVRVTLMVRRPYTAFVRVPPQTFLFAFTVKISPSLFSGLIRSTLVSLEKISTSSFCFAVFFASQIRIRPRQRSPLCCLCPRRFVSATLVISAHELFFSCSGGLLPLRKRTDSPPPRTFVSGIAKDCVWIDL